MRAGLEALALLPPESRSLLLEAAADPNLLVGVAGLQRASSERFRAVLSDFSPHQQVLAWQLVGHPALLDALASARSTRDVDAILADREPALARAARELVLEERDVLRAITRLHQQARREFEALLAGRALGTQASYRALVADSEALALLDAQSRLVTSVGALYRRDAAATLSALDEVADEVLARHASLLPGWETGSENGQVEDPGDGGTAVDAEPVEVAVGAAVVPVSIWLSARPLPLPARSGGVFDVRSPRVQVRSSPRNLSPSRGHRDRLVRGASQSGGGGSRQGVRVRPSRMRHGGQALRASGGSRFGAKAFRSSTQGGRRALRGSRSVRRGGGGHVRGRR